MSQRDSRLRGTLRYHGASTGRWSGARFQPQNLKKAQTKDIDAAIAAVRSGDLAATVLVCRPDGSIAWRETKKH
jgi:hypothetical protein